MRRSASILSIALVLAATNASAASREHYRSDSPDRDNPGDTTPLEDRRIVIAIDSVLGFGRTLTGEPANSSHASPITVLADHSIYVESFLGTLRVDVAKDWIVKATLPFTYMSFQATTGRRLGAQAIGNASLEADWRFAARSEIEHWAIVSVFAPTSGGNPPPPGELGPDWENVVNGFFANQAAMRARAMEQLAPWAYKRMSFVPRYVVSSPRPTRPWITYEASIAMENMFDTSGDASSKWASRFSGWLRGGYAFTDVVDVGVRVGYGIPLHGTDEGSASFSVEPQLRLMGPRLTAVLGIIVPLSGPATDPRFTSIHAGASLRF